MIIDDQITDEKIQYDINREAAKISALPSGKIDKYRYLASEEMLTSNKKTPRKTEQAKFTYSLLGKAFENKQKQLKIKEKNK